MSLPAWDGLAWVPAITREVYDAPVRINVPPLRVITGRVVRRARAICAMGKFSFARTPRSWAVQVYWYAGEKSGLSDGLLINERHPRAAERRALAQTA